MVSTVATKPSQEVQNVNPFIIFTTTPCYSYEGIIQQLKKMIVEDTNSTFKSLKNILRDIIQSITIPFSDQKLLTFRENIENYRCIIEELVTWDSKNLQRGYIIHEEYEQKINFIKLQKENFIKNTLIKQFEDLESDRVIKKLESLDLINSTNINNDITNFLYELGNYSFLNLSEEIRNKIIDNIKQKRPFIDEMSFVNFVENQTIFYIELLEKIDNEKNIESLSKLLKELNPKELINISRKQNFLLLDKIVKKENKFKSYTSLLNFFKNFKEELICSAQIKSTMTTKDEIDKFICH